MFSEQLRERQSYIAELRQCVHSTSCWAVHKSLTSSFSTWWCGDITTPWDCGGGKYSVVVQYQDDLSVNLSLRLTTFFSIPCYKATHVAVGLFLTHSCVSFHEKCQKEAWLHNSMLDCCSMRWRWFEAVCGCSGTNCSVVVRHLVHCLFTLTRAVVTGKPHSFPYLTIRKWAAFLNM